MNNNLIPKSELLFLYESTYNIPNGDPFTGEQRYDEETKKILVSDVRIKRFIRDYLEQNGFTIYITDKTEGGKTNSKQMIKHLYEKTFEKKLDDVHEILLNCIDVRLFGGISTLEKREAKVNNVTLKNTHLNLTGPIQFALLNPSLNSTELRMHQNTSHFISKDENQQGAIGTTTVVPYALNQIHGWINPYSALETRLSENDINLMLKALWESVNNINTRTKSNQDSLLILQIVYARPNQKLYNLDNLIKLNGSDKNEEQIRTINDFELDFDDFFDKTKSPKVSKVKYYTENEKLENLFNSQNKFEKIEFPEIKSEN